jgi:FkbM family methyltransferase
MLIDFNYLVKKYKITFRGILHVGAHECEEIGYYDSKLPRNKVLWVDALSDKVQQSIKKHKNILIECAAVSDKEEKLIFHRSNNGQSSSILELGTHKKHHPEIHYVDNIEMTTQLLSNILAKYPDIDFNFLNLDIQGAELKALKGMESYLYKVDYIYTEVNTEYVYENCALVTELDEYLEKFGLKRVEIKIYGNCGWGDAFYIRYRDVEPPMPSIENLAIETPTQPTSETPLQTSNNVENKISLCITTMKRFDTFLKASLEKYETFLDDGLINEIVISDETGEDYEKIKTRWGDKFRVFKNDSRLGVFKNKIKVIKDALYPTVILMDSDNFAPREYFTQVNEYIKTVKLSNNFILSPSFAKTGAGNNDGFDYRKYNGHIINRANIKQYISESIFTVLLNTGNYVFNKDLFANIKYDESVMNIISACDVIYFNLLAFQQYPDLELHIPNDLTYEHRVHSGSTYLTEITNKTHAYRDKTIIPAFKTLDDI